MKWVCVERREGTEREGEEEVVRWWKRREPLWVERDERVEEEEEEEEWREMGRDGRWRQGFKAHPANCSQWASRS
jgi:hypothetical protein